MSESETDSVTAFESFTKLLNKLGLQEFPCSFGTWREHHQLERKKRLVCSPEEISAPTLKDHNPKYERVETLLEYATSPLSPWSTDCNWSDEAAKLRQIAIKAPQKITDKFICSYFKTLRIRNENVIEIDADLLKLKNLKELTLSANRIVDVTSKNLPPSLKTLELSGNNITDLAPLCVKPPPLVHLGLSYNRVDNITEHLTAKQWPQLLCLDLFHNNLCDLKEVGLTLKTLPKLQSLVLVGNPVSLVPGYRGFLIDCLPTLNILDDFTITADERVNYKSLHLQTDYIENVAFIKLSIPNVKGLIDPQEQQLQTDVNFIQKSYFIQLHFIDGTAIDSKQTDAEKIPSTDKIVPSVHCQQTEASRDKQSCASLSNIGVMDSKNIAVGNQNSFNRSFLPSTNDSPPPTTVLQSHDRPWTENRINFEWNKVITCHNLLPLRDYLYQDLEFKIIERTLIGHLPVEEEEEDKSVKSKDKHDKKTKEDKGKKDVKSKTDAKSKNNSRKDKKNKFPIENIIWSASEFKVMATFYLSLETFLHGEHIVEETFTKEVCNASSDANSQKSNKKDSKGNKKNDSSSRAQSRAKGKKTPEMKKMKRNESYKNTPHNENDSPRLPPIEMGVLIELKHWTSTEEALQPTDS